MPRGKKGTVAQQVAKVRAKLLPEMLQERISERGKASPEKREEVKAMRDRCLPFVAALQVDMLMGNLPLDKEWFDASEKWLDRAEGKPAQAVNLGGGLTHKVQRIVVEKPSAG